MATKTRLCDIYPGERARITYIDSKNDASIIMRRLLDMGMTPDTEIECVGMSPSGDPKAYFVRGAVIALRSEDSASIHIIQA